MFGEKWQLDVKHIPKSCYYGKYQDKFYQYTVIDEATRERFIYAFKEYSSYNTIIFIQKAIKHFGYKPKIIQTDNGLEFTNPKSTKKLHLFDKFCLMHGVYHQLIRPRTPRHNGKVERSHRNDNERFYRKIKFKSLEELRMLMRKYLNCSNNLPMRL